MPLSEDVAAPSRVDDARLGREASIGDHQRTDREALTRVDWLLLVVVVVLEGVWTWRKTQNHWFIEDFWALLGDGDLTWSDLVSDHGGHWLTFHRLSAELLYDGTGLNYWPGAGVTGLVMWGIFSLWTAFVVNRMGATRLVSICVGVLVGMGFGVVFKPWLAGKLVGHMAWVTSSYLISGPRRSSRRLLLFATLTIGVASGFQTVCFLVAAIVYCSLRRQLRYWLPACLATLAIYLTWRRLVVTSVSSQDELSAWSLLAVPFHMFDVVVSAVERYFDVPYAVSAGLVILLVFVLVYRQFAQVASHHESLAALTLVIFTAAIVYSRVMTGIAPASAPRYTMPVMVFLLLGFAPSVRVRLPRPSTRSRVIASVALAVPLLWILSTQMDTRAAGFRFEESRSVGTEETVRTAAFLIDEGMPYDPDMKIRRLEGGGTLNFRQLADLVARGLDTDPVPDRLDEVQAASTITVADQATPGASSTCRQVDEPAPLSGDVVSVSGPEGRSIEIGWEGLAGGSGTQLYSFGSSRQLVFTFLDAEGASFRIDPLQGVVDVCE